MNKVATIILFSVLIAGGWQPGSAAPSVESPPVDLAYQHLAAVMDDHSQVFDVYTDLGAAANHFTQPAMLGTHVAINDSFTDQIHSGTTAIRGTFTGRDEDWGGWYWQNGVFLAGDNGPRPNWGDYPRAGYDLHMATALNFWARGEQGGERVEFFALGVGRDPLSGDPLALYPDSDAKVTLCGRLVTPCYITLAASWQPYTITLTGLDLSYVIGGFGWISNATENQNLDIAFYIDDIRYDAPHLDDPQLLPSYEVLPVGQDFDREIRDVAFTYDNALAMIAFATVNDCARARRLADALVYAQNHDRYYTDGRLRNAYQAGDLAMPPGWLPNGYAGTARLPGYWDPVGAMWIENPDFVGTYAGNVAWAMIGLIDQYEQCGGGEYLASAAAMGEWIESHLRDTRGAGGYTGGEINEETNPTQLLWKSTEHNLDIFVAFERLGYITGQAIWHERAAHAQAFVDQMWNEQGAYYSLGTLEDGVTLDTQAIVLDAQSLAVLAFGINGQTARALDFAGTAFLTTWGTYEGFDFNDDRDMPWSEGTAQAVLAYRVAGNLPQVERYRAALQSLQVTAPGGNGLGIVAAPADGLTTGLDWIYFNRLHVGATAWFVMSELGFTPYWPAPRVICPELPSPPEIRADGATVTLSWTVAPGAVDYNIYRATTPYFTPETVYANTANTTWGDPDPNAAYDPASNHYYVVLAHNSCGESKAIYRLGAFAFSFCPGVQ